MPNPPGVRRQHWQELESLRARLAEAEDTLRAIRSGEVDALVVKSAGGDQVFTLKGADQSYRILIETMSEGALTMTAEGLILYANRRFAELLGAPLETVIGSIIHAWIAPDSRRIFQALLSPGANENHRKELDLIAGNGVRVPVHLSLSKPLIDGMDGAFCLLVTDLTESNERKRLDQALQKRNAELENAKWVAEKASLAKSNFLSSMSHELRTPLNAILGFTQLLEGGSPPPTDSQSKRLQQISKAGWYLLELINEILDLSVIESGKLTLVREPVPLSEVMRECRSMIEPQAQTRGVQIHFLPFDPTLHVDADRTRLKQVLVNLLSNAIKYNRAQGTVEVTCAATPQRIRISVKDSGAGLPAEKLSQLFQPFNRLGQEAGVEEGTGIGLVVTKQLVERMGGAIGVASTVGVGSEFWIELIRTVAPERAAENALPAGLAPPLQANAAQRTLLYVEDNPANLMLVEHIMEDHPHLRLLSARDGNLGVALARAHLPDVILMDVNLPGISGLAAMHLLRRDPATMHIPIIALSANAMSHDIEKGLEAGFFHYLTKPIKISEFMHALNKALIFSARE